jgi:hypothetical protein
LLIEVGNRLKCMVFTISIKIQKITRIVNGYIGSHLPNAVLLDLVADDRMEMNK